MGYCSIHSHFEFLDTANALPNPEHKNVPDLARALKAYSSAGYSHVAVTEHGSFSSYEDLRALNRDYNCGLQIVPAIEGYIQNTLYKTSEVLAKAPEPIDSTPSDDAEDFDEIEEEEETLVTRDNDYLYKGSHVILIAKDEIGYRSLVEIMNHSVFNSDKTKKRMEIPIDVLRDHVEKGHVICSSACIGGVLAYPIIEEFNESRSMERAKELLLQYDYFELMRIKEEQLALETRKKVKGYVGAKKAALKKLKVWAGTDEEPAILEEIDHWMQVEQDVLEAKAEYERRAEEFAENDAKLKLANKHKLKSKYEAYMAYTPPTPEERAEIREKVDEIYRTFYEIFGDDFYVELQNHGLPEEREVYNTLVSYCEEKRAEGITPHYIQSNDIHISCRPDDINVDKMINARNLMKLSRMKIFDAFDEADKEYCIKTEEEISDGLRNLQGTYFDRLTGTERMSSITEEIIEESAQNTHLLEAISYEPTKENHYPAFEDADNLFDKKLAEGIKARFGCTFEELPEQYQSRILYEKSIMKQMDVIDYHLIVQEFLEFARYYGRIPENRRNEVEDFLEDTDRVKAFVEENNFPPATSTGCGRGSAGGSLICYCFNITEIDPIPYNLSMERYLNPERVSMPDIDSDISKGVREAVIRHCEKKYGYVCKVGTKGYCALRSAIDKAVDYIARMHYEEEKDTIDISYKDYKKRWLNISKAFKDKYLSGNAFQIDEDDLTDEEKEQLEEQERADFAQKLVGANLTPEEQEICEYYPYAMSQFTQLGQHACGMIISKDRLDNALPMYYNDARGNWQTQMTYPQAEDLGYLKMDMLGLITLDILNEIEQVTGEFATNEEAISHPGTYEIMRSGKTEGIFQMNGKRVAAHMRDDLRPDCIEDIIGENALNRPGPWDTFHEDYAARKHNPNYKSKNSIDTSYSPALTEILKPTYGCLLYQEQVMEIFRQLAGYTMGGADNVRRILGKKKVDQIAAEKPKFMYGNDGWKFSISYLDTEGKTQSFTTVVPPEKATTKEEAQQELTRIYKENKFADYVSNVQKVTSVKLKEAYIPGCKRNGISEKDSEKLFDIMAEFAKYAFNKSHSTAYAILACKTAYYKYKYPSVFYAATLNFQDNPKKQKNILKEIRGSNIRIQGPTLSNHSYRFKGNGNTMQYGLCGVKGFGGALENLEIRYASNLYDFCVLNPDIQKDI